MADRHRSPTIIVVGAGVAGLTAALHLAERGLHPIVLEADPVFCGGRLAGREQISIGAHTFRNEHGVHAIWSQYRNLQALLSRHRIRPPLTPAKEEAWYFKRGNRVQMAPVGKAIRKSWLPPPFHYLSLFFKPRFLDILGLEDWLSLPLIWYSLLLAVGIDPLGENQPMQTMQMSDILKGWSPAMRSFFTGLARNGLAGHPHEIPLSGFVAFLRFYTLLRRDAWAFSYLSDDGATAIIDPLILKLEQFGGEIILGAKTTHLIKRGQCWEVAYSHPITGDNQVILSDFVVLAVDAPAAKEIIESSNLVSPGEECYFPQSAATAIVRVWFDRQPKRGPEAGMLSGGFMIDNYFWLDRIQTPYLRWREETGGSAIEAHIYGPPQLLEEPEAAILAIALNDIHSAFPELRKHHLHHKLTRNSKVHTLLSVGPSEHHLGIQTPWKGIFCCGDWVRHPTPAFYLERACVTGVEAANHILLERNMQPWKLLAYLPPEPLAGWIEKKMRSGRRARRKTKYKGRKPGG